LFVKTCQNAREKGTKESHFETLKKLLQASMHFPCGLNFHSTPGVNLLLTGISAFQEQTTSRVKLDVSISTRVLAVRNPIKGKCCCSTLSVPIICVDNQVKKNEMGGACSTNGAEEECI
jgi:hypothetical protein